MLVGHFAAGLLAKRAAPKTSLGTLILGAMLADCLAAVFLIAGVEHWRMVPGERGIRSVDLYDIAISHSLATGILWGALLAAIVGQARFLKKRERRPPRPPGPLSADSTDGLRARRSLRGRPTWGAWAIFIVCISHWFLDVASHLPDMPLAPGFGLKLGLGLWTSLPATIAVEGSMWAVALFLYARVTRSRSRVLAVVFWIVVVLLTAIWIANFFAPPVPADGSAVTGAPQSLVFFGLVIAWAYWMNRTRIPASAAV
jgi:hypothetical protein